MIDSSDRISCKDKLSEGNCNLFQNIIIRRRLKHGRGILNCLLQEAEKRELFSANSRSLLQEFVLSPHQCVMSKVRLPSLLTCISHLHFYFIVTGALNKTESIGSTYIIFIWLYLLKCWKKNTVLKIIAKISEASLDQKKQKKWSLQKCNSHWQLLIHSPQQKSNPFSYTALFSKQHCHVQLPLIETVNSACGKTGPIEAETVQVCTCSLRAVF